MDQQRLLVILEKYMIIFTALKKLKLEFIIQIGPRNLWIQLNQINLN